MAQRPRVQHSHRRKDCGQELCPFFAYVELWRRWFMSQKRKKNNTLKTWPKVTTHKPQASQNQPTTPVRTFPKEIPKPTDPYPVRPGTGGLCSSSVASCSDGSAPTAPNPPAPLASAAWGDSSFAAIWNPSPYNADTPGEIRGLCIPPNPQARVFMRYLFLAK